MRQTKIAASSVLCLEEIHLKPHSPRCGRQWKLLLQISDPGTDERQVVENSQHGGLGGGENKIRSHSINPISQPYWQEFCQSPRKQGGKRGQLTGGGRQGLGDAEGGVDAGTKALGIKLQLFLGW